MEVLQIRKKFQITLPLSIREQLGLEEGDYIAVEVRDDEIVLRPKELVDKSQAWFWDEAWQAAEREAEADIQAGRVHEFSNAEEAIAFLHRRAAGVGEVVAPAPYPTSSSPPGYFWLCQVPGLALNRFLDVLQESEASLACRPPVSALRVQAAGAERSDQRVRAL